MNGCGACGQDFNGQRIFDAHRVGSHAYDYTPTRADGRRCRTVAEMEEARMGVEPRGPLDRPEAGT